NPLVHQNIVVVWIVRNLSTGRVQPAPDFVRRHVLAHAPLLETRFQLGTARRQDENADSTLQPLFYLARALYIDIQEHIMAPMFGFLNDSPGSPIIVAENERPFQEFIVHDHAFEGFAGNEVILLAVLLAPARLARGIGN